MSRLDSHIRRLTAQRDILNLIAPEIAARPGPIIELGLGNGRTYDHLRELFPDRRIIAFDREVNCHFASLPPENQLVLGEIANTTASLADGSAALVHADIGTGDPDRDAITVTWLPALVARLLRPDGIAASGLPLDHPRLTPLPLPEGVKADRYFLYRLG
ncbi:MAG: hypothetical protein DI533_09110 [Cereibacter sphaeroides]|uniref:S-adenosyl-L-methionine methyltransferase n=1 Tax=Cereibacter sphaeroides TaxID=1063 RepID=A0A2W5SEP3_CERSP|nr:MAG: hypothetical protein DI533_09110 [Cereibacter sphaeroides]